VSVKEVATVDVHAGQGDDFLQPLNAAAVVLGRAPNCRSVQIMRCVERRDSFLIVVVWDSVEDHARFRETPLFDDYRSHIQSFFASAPSFLHYESAE